MKKDTGITDSARQVWNSIIEQMTIGKGRVATSVPAVAHSGGGSPPGGTTGSGSSGGGSGGSTSGWTWFKHLSIYSLVVLGILVIYSINTTDMGLMKGQVAIAAIGNKNEREKTEQVLAQQKTLQMLAERSPVKPAPASHQSGTVSEQVSAPVMSSSASSMPIVHQMFTCTTEELLDAGYARNEVKRVSGGAEHQFSRGCAVVVIGANIRTMNARSYVFYEYEPKPGGFRACGDINMDQRPFSNEECTRFLNDNIGKNLMLLIRSGGSVVINSNN